MYQHLKHERKIVLCLPGHLLRIVLQSFAKQERKNIYGGKSENVRVVKNIKNIFSLLFRETLGNDPQ